MEKLDNGTFSNRASAANEIYTGFKSPVKITRFYCMVNTPAPLFRWIFFLKETRCIFFAYCAQLKILVSNPTYAIYHCLHTNDHQYLFGNTYSGLECFVYGCMLVSVLHAS